VRHSLVLLASLLVCACSPRADQVFVAPGQFVSGSSGAQPGYAVKLVRAKDAPSTVLGDDGSVCRLTVERFERVDVGDWLSCEWTVAPDTTASTARAVPNKRMQLTDASVLRNVG
jgi:hypothetical protein